MNNEPTNKSFNHAIANLPTVGKLIAILKQLPSNMKVISSYTDGVSYITIPGIDIVDSLKSSTYMVDVVLKGDAGGFGSLERPSNDILTDRINSSEPFSDDEFTNFEMPPSRELTSLEDVIEHERDVPSNNK